MQAANICKRGKTDFTGEQHCERRARLTDVGWQPNWCRLGACGEKRKQARAPRAGALAIPQRSHSQMTHGLRTAARTEPNAMSAAISVSFHIFQINPAYGFITRACIGNTNKMSHRKKGQPPTMTVRKSPNTSEKTSINPRRNS